jgi:chromosome segregation ATPase
VEYEGWFTDPAANIEKLRKFLDLPWQQSEADLALVLSGIIDPAARHDDPSHREASQPLVRTLYKLASRAGQDAGARDQIVYIVSQFVSFQQLQKPFLQIFEDVANTAAKYPAIEQEASALRASVSERDAVVEAAEGRAAGAEGRLAEALVEIDHQRGQIAELARERDAVVEAAEGRAAGAEGRLVEAFREIDHQRGQIGELARERDEVSRLNAALAERETVLADLSRRADELLAAFQAAQAEAAAREAALGRAEQEAQERGVAALAVQSEIAVLHDALTQAGRERAAAADAIQAEVTALRGTLAHAEREAQQRAVAAQAMEAEIAALRGRLAQAEGEASERAAVAVALQAETATLQSTLTAARQVGKATVAALRFDTAAPVKRDGPLGWRQSIMSFFGAWTSF